MPLYPSLIYRQRGGGDAPSHDGASSTLTAPSSALLQPLVQIDPFQYHRRLQFRCMIRELRALVNFMQ